MVYPSENPPAPKAMSDSDLNAKVAELQSQPGGLEAAMNLIEEQTRLRQQDSMALASWQLETQMRQVTPQRLNSGSDDSPTSEPSPVNPEAVGHEAQENYLSEQASKASSDQRPPAVPNAPAPQAAQEQPMNAVENVDDVVAALNASYAHLAAEQPAETPDSNIEENSLPELKVDEQVASPEPLPAPVADEEVVASDSAQETVLITETIRPTEGTGALIWSWLTFATTPLIVVLTALIVSSGASIAQASLLLAGIIFGFSLMAAIGSVAAKNASSSLPIISRASFGVWGNSVPTLFILLIKLVWFGALLTFAARAFSPLVFNQPWFAPLSERFIFEPDFLASALVILPILIVSSIVAGLGGLTILRSQQLTAVISLIGLAALGYFIFSQYSLSTIRVVENARLVDLLDLALLLLAIFGFTLVSQSGDFARKLPVETQSSKVFFLSFVSSFFIPLLAGIVSIAWFFMAEEDLAGAVALSTLPAIASITPIWVFVLFIVSLGISVIQLVSQSAYSVSASLYALGLKLKGLWQQLILATVAIVLTLSAAYLVPVSKLLDLITNLLLVGAVLAAAWLGTVMSDSLLRKTGYHEVSLTREYGFYGKFNWVNLAMFLVASGVGLGFIAASGPAFTWTGYLGNLFPNFYDQIGSFSGILMSFGIGLLTPIILGIPRIRKQELSHLELEQRRIELKEFLDTVD